MGPSSMERSRAGKRQFGRDEGPGIRPEICEHISGQLVRRFFLLVLRSHSGLSVSLLQAGPVLDASAGFPVSNGRNACSMVLIQG